MRKAFETTAMTTNNPHNLLGRNILVVEDEYLLADLLRHELEAAGAIVVGPAPSVAQGLALIADHAIDAAVLDVNLQGETVFAIADALRRQNVPFVFTTGYDQVAIGTKYQSVARCEKPFRLHILIAELSRIIRAGGA
jgi:DNA-binding response OmpR family regulator